MTEDILELFTDGASHGNPGPAGIGVVLQQPDGTVCGQLYKYIGEATNNTAEYLALVYALQEAHLRRASRVRVRMDSELVAKQMSGAYRVREPSLLELHALCRHLTGGFQDCRIEAIPRELNHAADRLAARGVAAAPDRALQRLA